jgi:hypothetical protein
MKTAQIRHEAVGAPVAAVHYRHSCICNYVRKFPSLAISGLPGLETLKARVSVTTFRRIGHAFG